MFFVFVFVFFVSILGEESSRSSLVGSTPGCPPMWPCNHTVGVRELLALSSPWYYGVLPLGNGSSAPYDAAMWPQLFDKVMHAELTF